MNFDLEYTTYGLENSINATLNNPTLLALSGVCGLASLVLSVLMIVSIWKIFDKAGKPGWASLIPIYNIIVLFQVAGMNPLNILLLFIPIANIIVLIKLYIGIGKKFNKGTGFILGLIFLGVFFFPILAFGDAVYEGNENLEKKDDSLKTTTPNDNKNNVLEGGLTNNGIEVESSNNIPTEGAVSNNENTSEPVVTNEVPVTGLSGVGVENGEAPTNDVPVVENDNVNNIISEAPTSNEPVLDLGNTNTVNENTAINEGTVSETINNVEPTEVVPFPDPIINTNESEASTGDLGNQKLCKTCGTPLPEIVSICPNCGSDNE